MASLNQQGRNIVQWKDTQTHNWHGPAFWTLISVAEKSSHSITESILACVHSAPWHAMAYGGKMWRGHKRRVGRQLATTVSVIDVFSFNISIVGIVWLSHSKHWFSSRLLLYLADTKMWWVFSQLDMYISSILWKVLSWCTSSVHLSGPFNFAERPVRQRKCPRLHPY